MDNHICFLITVLQDDDRLLRCAAKFNLSDIGEDCAAYPMEAENREIIRKLLPLHIGSIGAIVQIEQIFDVVA